MNGRGRHNLRIFNCYIHLCDRYKELSRVNKRSGSSVSKNDWGDKGVNVVGGLNRCMLGTKSGRCIFSFTKVIVFFFFACFPFGLIL